MAAIKLYEENIAIQCGYSFIEQQKNDFETFNEGIAIASGFPHCLIFFYVLITV